MVTTRTRILLLTQRTELETEFKAAIKGARVHVVTEPENAVLDTLLRQGIDLIAFDLDLSSKALATGIAAALGEYRDIPLLGLGGSDEEWHQLRRGSPVEEYIDLPFEVAALRQQVDRLLERGRFLNGTELVGQSSSMRQVRERILLVAPTPVSSILLVGESGTGKDLVAAALHRYSARRENPFRPLNCGAIPENLLENELFGHEKGAFTDARTQHQGIFEQADCGTVFLDEIGEMSLAAQVRLLRVLEQREVTRIGGGASISIDIRVIAATNRDLQQAVGEREFRLDLYHRLKVVEISIPPLRRRVEDIPLLIERFTRDLARDGTSRFESFSSAAMDLLQNYAWPGNVRELRNLIEHLIFLAPRALIEPEDLLLHLENPSASARNLPVPTNKTPDQSERELIYFALLDLKREVAELRNAVERNAPIAPSATPPVEPPVAPSVVQPITPENQAIYPVNDDSYTPEDRHLQGDAAMRMPKNAAIEPLRTLKDLEKEAIEEALNRVGGNRRKAADILGISARTLYRKLKEYDLE